MFFRKFDGTLMMVMHSPNIPAKERMLLFEMEVKGNKLYIVNEVTGNWITNKYLPNGKMRAEIMEGETEETKEE